MALYISGTRPSAAPESDQAEGCAPWWETPYGRWRLGVETEAMERFPGFRCCYRDGHLVWVGELRSSLCPRMRYLVTVTYPSWFPDEAPAVEIVSPEFEEGTPHLLERNRPCLYQSSHGARNGYDPARTTASTLVAWTALWIHAYETWQATGSWPGRAA
ncbi:MAG: hypothetical protein ACRDON_05335 [Gaiellaceae bacterium]